MSYRELHPTKEGHRRWRYVTTETVRLPLYGLAAMHVNCQMLAGQNLIAEIRHGWLLIHRGYAWNGCSPKRYIGFPPVGAWVGTPDFPQTIFASLGHDVLFQFSALLRYEMAVVNNQFFDWLDEYNAPNWMRDIYHGAVNMLGGKFWGEKDSTLKVIYS
jgi:hypothetical protein